MAKPQQSSVPPPRPPSPAHSSSSSSSASPSSPTAAAQHPAVPQDPPKIPPPPSEHPPPYTPFSCGQNSSLLPGSQPPQEGGEARTNRRRRVVEPPGFRKYLRHFTPRNVLIFAALLFGLCLLIYLVHRSNKSDVELSMGKALEESHRPLAISHKGLGAIKGGGGSRHGDRISFDDGADAIVLSEFDPDTKRLRWDLLELGEHLDGFRRSSVDLAQLEGEEAEQQLLFDDCMRFSAHLFCCSTPSQGHQHLTKCFLQTPRAPNRTSVASMFDFMLPGWQYLADGEQLLLVHNRQRQAVLDLRRNILHQIDESQLPRGYISYGFHFPQGTSDELAQLVRIDDHFRICLYVRTHEVDQDHGIYAMKGEACRETPFKLDFELRSLLFCVTPLYTAVVQYGHLPGETAMLTWRLGVKFDSSQWVYSAGESLHARHDQMAMDCDAERVNLFVPGDHELHQFSAQLPTLRNGHFAAEEQKK